MSFVTLAELSELEPLPLNNREKARPLVQPSPDSYPTDHAYPKYGDHFPSESEWPPPLHYSAHPHSSDDAYNYKFDPVSFYKQPFMDRLQLPILISILYFLLQLPLIPAKYVQWLGMDAVLYHETTGLPTMELKLIKSVSMGFLFYVVHFVCFLNM